MTSQENGYWQVKYSMVYKTSTDLVTLLLHSRQESASGDPQIYATPTAILVNSEWCLTVSHRSVVQLQLIHDHVASARCEFEIDVN